MPALKGKDFWLFVFNTLLIFMYYEIVSINARD